MRPTAMSSTSFLRFTFVYPLMSGGSSSFRASGNREQRRREQRDQVEALVDGHVDELARLRRAALDDPIPGDQRARVVLNEMRDENHRQQCDRESRLLGGDPDD